MFGSIMLLLLGLITWPVSLLVEPSSPLLYRYLLSFRATGFAWILLGSGLLIMQLSRSEPADLRTFFMIAGALICLLGVAILGAFAIHTHNKILNALRND